MADGIIVKMEAGWWSVLIIHWKLHHPWTFTQEEFLSPWSSHSLQQRQIQSLMIFRVPCIQENSEHTKFV